ncbi:hypothetical protein PIB30_011304 [Stylosanthes scabra]|uniref:Uncharacterized protein n=1 Tax=Stylosanthes scabra TaxID=79078 RepID=A0ABU6V6J7_9FABA|nr:hypothetical protein [Stylosanthes scabra]
MKIGPDNRIWMRFGFTAKTGNSKTACETGGSGPFRPSPTRWKNGLFFWKLLTKRRQLGERHPRGGVKAPSTSSLQTWKLMRPMD